MASSSRLTGSLTIGKRPDASGGDLHVDGALTVNRNGERVNILTLPIAFSRFTQSTPSKTWKIEHTLETAAPFVKILVDGSEVQASIDYAGATREKIEIHFAIPCAGEAILFAVSRDSAR